MENFQSGRAKYIFKTKQSCSQLVLWVASSWKIYVDISIAIRLVKRPRDNVHWNFPPLGWVRVNFDGTVQGNHEPARCRGMVRDDNGRFISAVPLPLGC